MEIGPELQGTLVLVANALGGFIVWKLKSYRDRADKAERRAAAITRVVDEALDDGEISPKELKRLVHVASFTQGGR